MLLAVGPSFEFVKFLQVLGWIILPVTIIASIFTIVLHFRKKRNRIIQPASDEEKLLAASPEKLGYTRGDGEYVFFDHSALISEYKRKLSFNLAKYSALKSDFDKLQVNYSGLASYTVSKFNNKKAIIMENSLDQLPQPVQDEVAKLLANHKAEKENMHAELSQMRTANDLLLSENKALKDDVSMYTGSDEEKTVILRKWKEENFRLKEKISEQQYLQEVIEEKKAQIGFLQGQLETRIRNTHQAEQQREKAITELEEERSQHSATLQKIETLKSDFLLKQDEVHKLQVAICGKEEQLMEKDQQLRSKADQVTWLENVLQETKQHTDLLHASSMDDKSQIATPQEQHSAEQSRAQYLEQRLLSNKNLLNRLHKELSTYLGQDSGESPVIALRPDFVNLENEEAATN